MSNKTSVAISFFSTHAKTITLVLLLIILDFYNIVDIKNNVINVSKGLLDSKIKNSTKPFYSSIDLAVKVNAKYDFAHLTQATEKVWGPLQDDEALFLYGFIKVIRPKVIVECGMLTGYSTVNFLKALDADASHFTFDIVMHNPKSPAFLDKRFKFVLKSQADFSPADINNQKIDFVYVDNGHYFDVNVEFWKKVIASIQPNGIMAVHDTGLHNRVELPDESVQSCVCDFDEFCGIEHVPPERQFINWVIDNYPEWEVLNFHSFNFYRHGLTFLQRKYKFNRLPQPGHKCNKTV